MLLSKGYIFVPRKDYRYTEYSNGYNIPTNLRIPKSVFEKIKQEGKIELVKKTKIREYYIVKDEVLEAKGNAFEYIRDVIEKRKQKEEL